MKISKYLPDLNIISTKSENWLIDAQPFYRVFILKIKKSDIANLNNYVHLIFSDDMFIVDENKIKAFQNIPIKDNNTIRELSQRLSRNNFAQTNEEYIKSLAKKIGTLTEKENAAFKVVNVIILKILINEVIVMKNSRIFNAFLKPFLSQYYNDYNSMSMRYKIPQEIIEHIDRIVAPDFDIVYKEFIDELHNPNFYYCKYSLHQLENLKQLLVKERAINDNINFAESFKEKKIIEKYKTDWLWSKPEAYYLFFLINEKKEFYNGERIDKVANKLFRFCNEEKKRKTDNNFSRFQKNIKDENYIEKKLKRVVTIHDKFLFP